MENILNKTKSFWPVMVIAGIVILLGITNFKSGTILTGWDNLHPEFATDVNIQRSIFAVWQEYQGLGLLGGMGHASDLVRQVFLAILALIIPTDAIRYVWMILTLFFGATGTFVLLKSHLLPYTQNKKETLALCGGIFYLLNLATFQTYFVAFEAFTSHYAALPWLLHGALSLIKHHNKKNFLLFSLIVLLTTPAGYIPTLFVAFLIALTIIVGGLIAFANNKISLIKKALSTYALIGVINAFWLLPFLFFTLTQSSVNVGAKMNQMATETIFQQNKEYGNILSVMQLKGFWFSNIDPDLQGNFRLMLSPWIEHFNNPVTTFVSLALFGIIFCGIIYVLKNRRPIQLTFLLLFLFAFAMLATNTPPFSHIVSLFRMVPLFDQAFRFPFTKFSILVALVYAIFFTFGISFLSTIVNKIANKFSLLAVSTLAILLIGAISLPAFGGLFYEKEQVSLPAEYKKTFAFFRAQDQNTRIANLPQHTFWGWNFYEWGYGGSGFLWYGIKQPILDRAFDVWSDELENYYYELSSALYSKDSIKVAQVLNKYQVNWILVDRNVYSPFSPKAVHLDESEALLSQIPTVKKVQQFGKISIYEVDLFSKANNYLFTTSTLPKVNSYAWNNEDSAYSQIGNYASTDSKHDVYFPFRTLFSYRTPADYEYKSIVTNDSVTFTSRLPRFNKEKKLTVPLYSALDRVIPVEFMHEVKEGSLVFSLKLLTPIVTIDNKTITNPQISFPIFEIQATTSGHFLINNNGTKEYAIDASQPFSKKTYLSLTQDNYITLKNESTGEVLSNVVPASYLSTTVDSLPVDYTLPTQNSEKEIKITVPRIIDGIYGYSYAGSNLPKPTDCNAFRMGSVTTSTHINTLRVKTINDTVCTAVDAPTLPHTSGYMMVTNTTNIKGRPLHFWVENLDQKYAPVDTFLQSTEGTSTIILNPMEEFGQGYSFHFENISVGNNEVENTLSSFSVFPIPYQAIKGIVLSSAYTRTSPDATFTSTHPNESVYYVENLKSSAPFTLVLAQSYDPGWKAYAITNSSRPVINNLKRALPFIFGKEIKTHIKVNNWSNGWEIDPKQLKPSMHLQLVYVPQYLQFVGFMLLGIPFFPLFLLGNTKYVFPLSKKLNRFFDHHAEAFKHEIHARLNS